MFANFIDKNEIYNGILDKYITKDILESKQKHESYSYFETTTTSIKIIILNIILGTNKKTPLKYYTRQSQFIKNLFNVF